MPRRQLGPFAACIAALALAACTTSHDSYRPESAYLSRAAHVFRGTETFCLNSPLSGTARYSVDASRVRFTLDIHGLPPKTGIGLDWINNPVRGYLIGAFSTDAAGSYNGAARTFRAGEVRAIAIKFQRSDGTGLPGIGKPCHE